MYTPNSNTTPYQPYPYRQTDSQQQQQQWSNNQSFESDSQMNQPWYIPPQPNAGPSTYQQQQPPPPKTESSYPPGSGSLSNTYRPPVSSGHSVSSSYTTPQLSSGNELPEPVTEPLEKTGQDKSTVGKKRRKKGTITGLEKGESPTEMDKSTEKEKVKEKDKDKDKDKEKRTKTGRACDACVSTYLGSADK